MEARQSNTNFVVARSVVEHHYNGSSSYTYDNQDLTISKLNKEQQKQLNAHCSYVLQTMGETTPMAQFLSQYNERPNRRDTYDSRHVLKCHSGLAAEFHKNHIYCVEEDPQNRFTNPHQEAAELRKYYEWLNVTQFGSFDAMIGVNHRRIVDVGASKRLIHKREAIPNYVALNPHCGLGDYEREAKAMFTNDMDRVEYCKLADYTEQLKPTDLLLFTDSYYYIQRQELLEAADKMRFGVIAAGSAHVLSKADDTDGYLRIDDYIFGEARPMDDKHMYMIVDGNPEAYCHPQVLKQSLNKNVFMIFDGSDVSVPRDFTQPSFGSTVIKGRGYKLFVKILDRFDMGATIYTRFIIIKAKIEEDVQIDLPTRWQRTNCHRLDCAVSEAKQVEGEVNRELDLVQARGVASAKCPRDAQKFRPQVVKVGQEEMCYKVINGQIVTVKVEHRATKNDNVLRRVQKRLSNIQMQVESPDFAVPMDIYNKLVKEIMKCKEVNLATLKSAIMVAQLNMPAVSMRDYLVPIIGSALKEALGVETRLLNLLSNEEVAQLNAIRDGEDITGTDSIFTRVSQALVDWFTPDF